MKIKKLIERLAASEHEQWIHWMRYMLEKSEYLEITMEGSHSIWTGPLVIFKKRIIEDWRGKFIPYEDLREDEKESDRVWAIKILEVISDFEMELEGIP